MSRVYKSRTDAEKAATAKNKKSKVARYTVETRYQIVSKRSGKKSKKPYIDIMNL